MCSCGSVYNGETRKKIISRSVEHQQECIKCNWSSSGATEMPGNGQRIARANSTGYTPKLSMKNRYYDRKVRESLEIDTVVVRYGQDKLLSSYNGNFVKTNAWKPLLKKMKKLH